MRRPITAVLVLLVACGDGGSNRPDAAPVADAGPPDAGVPRDLWYVMDAVQIPETIAEANALALDLDGDGQPDNALGGMLAALHDQADLPIAAAHLQAVVSGRALTLVGIEGIALAEGGAAPVLVSPGSDLDDDPGDNFSGSEPFERAPLEGADGELPGTLARNGRLRAGPGEMPVLLALTGDPSEVAVLRGVGGRIDCLASAEGLAEGRLGVAFSDDEVNTRLIPSMAIGLDAVVQRDCPEELCEPGSPGEEVATFFDDNEDLRITAEELLANSLISSTIGNPDLDLLDEDGDYNPDVDGVKDSLSVGLGFTAVRAALAE
jgi:hypothetical protein